MDKILEILATHGFTKENGGCEGESDEDFAARTIDVVFAFANDNFGTLDILALCAALQTSRET